MAGIVELPHCPTFDPEQVYVCQPPEVQPGESEGEGCNIGCDPCPDLPGELLDQAVRVHGKRWLKPDMERQARDAHGLIHDIRSGEPHLVPPVWGGLRSPCWKNDGTECHQYDVCECHPGESDVEVPDSEPPRCELGEFAGELLLGMFPDCTAFTGYRWVSASAAGSWMDCRNVDEHGNIRTTLVAGLLHQSMFHRFGDSSSRTRRKGYHCDTNAMTECVASVIDGGCEMGYFNVHDPPPDYYHDDPCRQVFNFCEIIGNTAGIQGTGAVVAAKNAVLDVIRNSDVTYPDGRNLRQMTYFGMVSNGQLDYWAVAAGMAEGISCEDASLPVAMTFPNSYLKNARCPVHAELVVVTAEIAMSLVPYKADVSSGPTDFEYQRQVYPHARVQITGRCGVRATLPSGECILMRPWIPAGEPGHMVTLSIVNPTPGDGLGCIALPSVVDPEGNVVDEIIYVDAEGRKLQPPLYTEWWGFLGAFSDPPTADVWTDADSCPGVGGMTAYCLRLADALTPLTIPSWPYMIDSMPNNPNQVYEGYLELSFKVGSYESCCGGGAP
jgi:hypothetical protein